MGTTDRRACLAPGALLHTAGGLVRHWMQKPGQGAWRTVVGQWLATMLFVCAAKALASAMALRVARAASSLPAMWTVVQRCGAQSRAALNAWWMASWAVMTRTGPA